MPPNDYEITCPECAQAYLVREDVPGHYLIGEDSAHLEETMTGMIIDCSACGLELEIVKIEPGLEGIAGQPRLSLAKAPEEKEDWGE